MLPRKFIPAPKRSFYRHPQRWLLGSTLLLTSAIAPGLTARLATATPLSTPQRHTVAQVAPAQVAPAQVALTTRPQGLPNAVSQAVRQKAAQRFSAPLGQMQIVSFSSQNWPDGCLGLGQPEQMCTQAIVPGWYVTVTDGLQSSHYRTDRTGSLVLEENPNRAVLPRAIALKLIAKVRRDSPQPFRAGAIRISEVKSASFDGCLGIYRPNQACTMIAQAGWRVILVGPTQSWVYHLTQDGRQIAQNSTASGAGSLIRLSFELFGSNEVPQLDPNIVFESNVSGGLAGMVTRIVLTQDGKLTRYTSGPMIRTAPVVLRTLTAQQVRDFQQVLETQRFPNLNGLSYLTSAALADYPTTQYQSQGSVMQLIDLEKPSLPRSLQAVIAAWEQLMPRETPNP